MVLIFIEKLFLSVLVCYRDYIVNIPDKKYLESINSFNKAIFKKGLTNDMKFIPNTASQSLGDCMRRYKGQSQQERMIRDRRRTLDKALKYSFQSAYVKNLKFSEDSPSTQALINPNKTKQDYDDKIIAIGYEENFVPGDIFCWEYTNTYWLIYLQDLEELSYFRGDIRRCRYVIAWEDEEGKRHSTYAALRGPVETKINYIQKSRVVIDVPNYSLEIMIPKNEDTLKYFTRYNKFFLQEDKSVCWRIEAVDSYSMPGIIQFNAVEYYINTMEDDIEEGIVGKLKVDLINPNPDNESIRGETFIKPKTQVSYEALAPSGNSWSISPQNVPVEIVSQRDTFITIRWTATYSGQFDLKYGDKTKTIVVESLF